MATDYQRILEARHDTTQWLLHFTRDAMRTSSRLEAREVLRNILTEGALHPNWSERKNRATIYGDRPAVCFTEMPLLGFCEYINARAGSMISGYGIALHKRVVFAEGGRPAIYEPIITCDTSNRVETQSESIENPSDFPSAQRYRLVRTDLTTDPPTDWTHEREWRWPQQKELGKDNLEFSGSHWRCRRHVFVRHTKDIKWIQNQLDTILPSAGSAKGSHNQRYIDALRTTVGVISLEYVEKMVKAGERAYARLETWPKTVDVDIVGMPGAKARADGLFKTFD